MSNQLNLSLSSCEREQTNDWKVNNKTSVAGGNIHSHVDRTQCLEAVRSHNPPKHVGENLTSSQVIFPWPDATGLDTNTEYHITMGHPCSADSCNSKSINKNSCETYSNAVEPVEHNISSSLRNAEGKRTVVEHSESASVSNDNEISLSEAGDMPTDFQEDGLVREGIVNIDVYYDSTKCDNIEVAKPNDVKESNAIVEVNPIVESCENPSTSNPIDKPLTFDQTMHHSDSEDFNIGCVPRTADNSEDSKSQATMLSNSEIPNSTNSHDNNNLGSNQSTKNKKHQKSNMKSSTITSDSQDKGSQLKEVHSEVDREPTIFKKRKIDFYIENKGPRWYKVGGNIITRNFIPNKLSDVFNYLPIFGRPQSKAGLQDFQDNKIREFIGYDLADEEFESLAKYCSPEHLTTGKELVMSTMMPRPGLVNEIDMEAISADPSPDTIEVIGSYEPCVVKKSRMRTERIPNNQYLTRLKYRGVRMSPHMLEDNMVDDEAAGALLEPGKDTLYRVRIYRPFHYNQQDKPNSRRHSVFCRDVVLVGRQPLTELRDMFPCPNDLDLRLDVSHRPDAEALTTGRELFPSGFLFINNVFYVDDRAGCHDRTATLRAWAATRGVGRFERESMCGKRVQDIVLRLGHPDVYVHQGSCEHLFLFSEVRLVNPTDALLRSSYPCHTCHSQNHTVYCTTCAEFSAKWVVTSCNRVPFDPAFFCETCLRQYMYDKDGKKVGDFKAYSYMGNDINMHKGL